MYHLAAQTGMRKAEMTKAAGDKWTRKEVAMTNVRWLINGTIYNHLTPGARRSAYGRERLLPLHSTAQQSRPAGAALGRQHHLPPL